MKGSNLLAILSAIVVSTAGATGLASGDAGPGTSATGQIFAFTGNDPGISGFLRFANATGKTLVSSATMPTSLAAFDCALLPANGIAFTPAQTATLESFVNGGGRLFALGEFHTFRGGAALANMNALATALGSSLALEAVTIDIGFHTTNDIVPSGYTEGVDALRYAATSRVTVSGSAVALARTVTGAEIFLGAEPMGSGTFVLSGDTNVFSDSSSTGYSVEDNGILVRDLCGGTPTALDAEPVVAVVTADPAATVNAPVLRATLTRADDGTPLAGKTVRFYAKETLLCTATTDAQGIGACSDPSAFLEAVLHLGYEARFGGDGPFEPSGDGAPLLDVLGNELP